MVHAVVSGVDRTGGISGILHYGNQIQQCRAENVEVIANSSYETVGGIAGTFLTDASHTQGIYDCVFIGSVRNDRSYNIGKNAILGGAWNDDQILESVDLQNNIFKANAGTYADQPMEEEIADGYKAFAITENDTTTYVIAPKVSSISLDQNEVTLKKGES